MTLMAQTSLSLSQAIEKGLQNNYQIQIAEHDIEIASNNNDWGIAGKYPSITLNLSSSNTYTNRNDPSGFLTEQATLSNGITPSVNLNWILFDGYRVQLTKQQLEKVETLSQNSAKVTVENSIQDIILAYYNVLLQQQQLAVIDTVLRLSRDRVEYQEIRKEFGQAGTFDLLQSQNAYLDDSTNYLIQVTNYENAFRNLNLTMGEDDLSQRYELTDVLEFAPATYELANLQERMLANNYQLNNLFINRELAKINTQIQESRLKPTLSLNSGLSYGYSISNGSQKFINQPSTDINASSRTLNGNINLTAAYTLFDGNIRKINIQNAKVEEMISQLTIEDTKRMLRTQLNNTLATYNNQKQLVDVTKVNVENAHRNLNISEERFRGGLISSFDYRTVQLNYVNATQTLLNSIYNLKVTETELTRLIGGLVRK
ncbi:MAG: membrane protein [Saprospiraceae bacterium]|nr:MAG: membrane protein [Saprospiraceae bacterium]